MDYAFHVKQQAKKIQELSDEVNDCIKVMDQMNEEIERLTKENTELKKLLTQNKEVKKTSRNSNLPPSTDINKDNRTNKRPKSDKPSGGQPGHKGHTLDMLDNPDKVIPSIPKVCFNCGNPLDDKLKILNMSRQVFDIPKVQYTVNQFDSYKITCECGTCNLGKFPDQVVAKTQYGQGVRSWISYLTAYQFISYNRIKDFFNVAFNINLSEGTIFKSIKRTATKAEGLYQFIQKYLCQSDVVGADETTIRVKGKKYYIWVWQNKNATFIIASDNRRKDNIYEYFPHGFPCATLVSDRYAAHLSTPAKMHQICWAHIVRHCQYLIDSEDNQWVHQLINIYQRAKHLEKLKNTTSKNGIKAKKMEDSMNHLLIQNIDADKFPKTAILQKSLLKNREALFNFVYHKKIPSHNNASEIAIRNFKVKMKVSGQFKSAQNYFVVIRSLIDTLIKNNKPIFDSLRLLEANKDVPLGFAPSNT